MDKQTDTEMQTPESLIQETELQQPLSNESVLKMKESISSSLLQMQNSTDTLVDEAQLLLSKKFPKKEAIYLNGNGQSKEDGKTSTGTLSPAHEFLDEHLASMKITNDHQHQLHVATTSSESSTSSTIPSPTFSTGDLPKMLITATTTSNSVSTSTSGLFDYVQSSKFQHINETIRFFNANNHLSDQLSNLNDFRNEIANGDGIYNGSQINGTQVSNAEYITKLNSNTNSNNRIPSNSIPIKNKPGNDTSNLKKRKKSIKDFIDVDGLTKIDDRTYRKIIERDEKYKVKKNLSL